MVQKGLGTRRPFYYFYCPSLQPSHNLRPRVRRAERMVRGEIWLRLASAMLCAIPTTAVNNGARHVT